MSAHILVIEDNPTNLELMTYLLQAFQYEVSGAGDGGEGLEAVRNKPPDLVICDVHLPTVSGYEVARQMKGDPAIQSIPLIAVTALAMVGDRDKVLSAGFDGYISKPIAPESFVQEVESFLPADQHSRVDPAIHGTVSESPKHTPAYNATILIIDDDALNVSLKRTILEPFGYRVVAATSVHEAFQLCEDANPDLIITDIHLGDGTGHDVLKRIKSERGLRDKPVLVLSASATPEDYQLALKAGALKVLVSPIEPHLLLSEVASAIQSAGGNEYGNHTGR
jgi:two-component system cell cycle response regulator